jgi:hypothetical protein
MRRLPRVHLPAHQRGLALLILLAIVSMGFVYALVAGLNRSAGDLARARDLKTYAALAQAKEALIAYAVTYKEMHNAPGGRPPYTVPGYLPCPDLGPLSTVPEGVTALNCDTFLVSAMGRLPWKTLGLDALRDGSGECLWYAVSGTYKYSPNGVLSNNATPSNPNNMMNWDTNGQFNIMDTNGTSFLAGSTDETRADTRAVAVIFAPGGVVSGQNRTLVAGTAACGGNYTAAAYLETANGINNSTLGTPSSPVSVTDVKSFIAGTSSNTFNDKLVYITRADIWNAIKKRSDFNNNLRALTRRAAECTAMYGIRNGAGLPDKRLPWASSVSMSSLDRYAVDRRYRDVTGTNSGRLSYRVSVSDSATNNALSSNTDLGYNNFLLFTPNPYCAYTLEENTWYDNWKDQLFYAIANEYKPSASSSTGACTGSTCLKINGSSTYYAAVVIFAGEKLSGQNRNTLSDKSQISNYLEGRNASNHPNTSGNGDYQGGSAGSAFNDFVYAIDTNLAVSCYDAASGTMMSAHTAACP